MRLAAKEHVYLPKVLVVQLGIHHLTNHSSRSMLITQRQLIWEYFVFIVLVTAGQVHLEGRQFCVLFRVTKSKRHCVQQQHESGHTLKGAGGQMSG